MRAHERRCRVAADRVIRELAAVAFADIGDVLDEDGRLLPWSEIPPPARRAIARITVRRCRDGSETVTVVMRPKLAALDKLARHLGLYRKAPAARTGPRPAPAGTGR